MKKLLALLSYLKTRIAERSTWVGFGAAVAGAAALSSPYSWIVIGCGCIAMLIPEATNAGPKE